MAKVDLNMHSVMRQTTLKVKIKNARQLTWRLRVAAWLIRLAAWVAWMNVEFEPMEAGEDG